MNVFADIRAPVERRVAGGTLPDGLPSDAVTAVPLRDATGGDMAFNAEVALAKPARANLAGVTQETS